MASLWIKFGCAEMQFKCEKEIKAREQGEKVGVCDYQEMANPGGLNTLHYIFTKE